MIELRDRALEVHFRPGHSPSDTVFYDPDRKQLLARRPPDQAHLVEPADHARPGDEGDPASGRSRS